MDCYYRLHQIYLFEDLSLGETKTTADFSGLIFNLLALHHFLRLFNSSLELSLSLDKEELLKTRQISSAKRRGLDKVALPISFI